MSPTLATLEAAKGHSDLVRSRASGSGRGPQAIPQRAFLSSVLGNQAIQRRALHGGEPGPHPAAPGLLVNGSTEGGCACGGTCEDCKKKVQRKAEGALPAIPEKFDATLQQSGHGTALEPGLRHTMETRFGSSFEEVRLHSDPAAARAAQLIRAQAFTVGRDIYFGEGRYQPHSPAGQRLLAHELTHALQQRRGLVPPGLQSRTGGREGDVFEQEAEAAASRVVAGESVVAGEITPVPSTRVQRISLEDIEADVEAAGEKVVHGVEAVGEKAVAAGRAAVRGAEAVGEAAVQTGKAVIHGAEAVGEAALELGEELWGDVQAMARALGGVISFSGGRLVITVPPLEVLPPLAQRFRLPEIGKDLPFILDGFPLAEVVFIYGTVGLHAGVIPELAGQIGPCRLSGLRIVIDPLARSFSAAGALSITVALGLAGEAHLALRGEVGALVVWPDPPIPIKIPVVGLEAGLAGYAGGLISDTIFVAERLAYSGGTFSLAEFRHDDIGLAVDLGLAGYGAVDLLGQNLCTLYWPLWRWHKDTVLSLGLGLGLSVGSGGISANLDVQKPQLSLLAFGDLPVLLRANMFSDDCPICDVLRRLGLMPSQIGGPWPFHPTPPWPGPLPVYPRDPHIPSGAFCRGACGPDCKTCTDLGPMYLCMEDGAGGHEIWEYPNWTVCPTHQGCREHDACYDWAADKLGEKGVLGILGPGHRLCDLECICTYNTPQCVGWIFGSGGDDVMFFSDRPGPIGGCRGACPVDMAVGAPAFHLCLPDIELFAPFRLGDSLGSSTGRIDLHTIPIDLPYGLGVAFINIFAGGSVLATLGAQLGPAVLQKVCLDFDLASRLYRGTAELHVLAGIDGSVNLTGSLGADVNWLCLVKVAEVVGQLSATGTGRFFNDLVVSAAVSCRNGEIVLDTSVGLNPCLELGFRLDGSLRATLFGFEVFDETWRLTNTKWDECWPIEFDVSSIPFASGATATLGPHNLEASFVVPSLLNQALDVDVEKGPPADPAAASHQANPCPVRPKLECGVPQLPFTKVDFAGSDRGEKMLAEPLTRCGPPGSRPSIHLPGWSCIEKDGPNETDFWVHAHLLHGLGGGSADLHGPGNDPRNLIISDKSLNLRMFNAAERTAIERAYDQDQVLSYLVEPEHVANTGDRRYFADAMDITLKRIDPVTHAVLEEIFKGTVESRKPRAIPSNCT